MLDYDVGQYTDVAMLFRTLETSKLENVRNLLKTLWNQCEVQLESTPSRFKSDVKVLDSYLDMKLAFDEEGSNILISADKWYKSREFDFVAFDSSLPVGSSLLCEDAILYFSLGKQAMVSTDIVKEYMEKCKKLKVLYDLVNHLSSFQSDLGWISRMPKYFADKALEIYNLGEDIEDIDKTVAKGNKLVAAEVHKWSQTFTNSKLMRVLPEEKKNADMELYLIAAKARMWTEEASDMKELIETASVVDYHALAMLMITSFLSDKWNSSDSVDGFLASLDSEEQLKKPIKAEEKNIGKASVDDEDDKLN